MIRFVLAFLLLATPALADYCEEAWLTRNLIFNRAGYCFGSVLGQSLFDNRDCHTKSPTLSAQDQQIVNDLREAEEWVGCRVNTGATTLSIRNLATRMALPTLPVPDEVGGYGCFGWRGAVVPVYWDIRQDSKVVAQVQPGDDVFWEYYPRGPWSYIGIRRGGQLLEGWAVFPDFLETRDCTSAAG